MSTLNIVGGIKNFSSIKSDKDWSFKDATRSETTALTHSYHRYPAKFIPNIVEKLLSDFTKTNDLVLDPFGGCGTTLVESKRMGRMSVCFDINPIAKFIAEVKVTPINPKILVQEYIKFEKKLLIRGEIINRKHLENERVLYWFDEKTIKQLDYVYCEINKIKNKHIRKFFLCAFSHNLKNSSRWLMKSIKPTVDKNKVIPNVVDGLLRHIKLMIRKNDQFYCTLKESGNLRTPANVLLRDSTKRFSLKNSSIDLIITSPPYVTSYEYADLHQLSLLWFADNKKDFQDWHVSSRNFKEYRKNFIGTSYKNKQKGEIGSITGENILKKIFDQDKTLSKDVSNYFIDMKLSFEEMYRVLKKKGYACIVIGNTELKGVSILNAEVAVEQMMNIGFKKTRVIKREVQNKMITPWRDTVTGKFTNMDNPNKKCAYEYEYILIMEK